jgi:hypothetical protein
MTPPVHVELVSLVHEAVRRAHPEMPPDQRRRIAEEAVADGHAATDAMALALRRANAVRTLPPIRAREEFAWRADGMDGRLLVGAAAAAPVVAPAPTATEPDRRPRLAIAAGWVATFVGVAALTHALVQERPAGGRSEVAGRSPSTVTAPATPHPERRQRHRRALAAAVEPPANAKVALTPRPRPAPTHETASSTASRPATSSPSAPAAAAPDAPAPRRPSAHVSPAPAAPAPAPAAPAPAPTPTPQRTPAAPRPEPVAPRPAAPRPVAPEPVAPARPTSSSGWAGDFAP